MQPDIVAEEWRQSQGCAQTWHHPHEGEGPQYERKATDERTGSGGVAKHQQPQDANRQVEETVKDVDGKQTEQIAVARRQNQMRGVSGWRWRKEW